MEEVCSEMDLLTDETSRPQASKRCEILYHSGMKILNCVHVECTMPTSKRIIVYLTTEQHVRKRMKEKGGMDAYDFVLGTRMRNEMPPGPVESPHTAFEPLRLLPSTYDLQCMKIHLHTMSEQTFILKLSKVRRSSEPTTAS